MATVTGILDNLLGVNDTSNGKPVLKLFVFDAVPPHQDYSSFPHLVQTSGHNFSQYRDSHRLNGKTDYVHGRQRFASYRIDITERISGSDLTECVGVVNNRCEEINGLDDGQIATQLIDASVFSSFYTRN